MNAIEFEGYDKTFTESMFLTKINNIFVKLHTCIMRDKLDEVSHFINDDVMQYALSIINNAKGMNGRQMYDELNVKDSRIVSIEVKENVYEIKVYLQSRYMDYIMSLSNGNLLTGNNSSRVQVNYELTFTKKIDSKIQGTLRKCPNCGAALDLNNSGKCEYCGGIYKQEDYDWILSKVEVLNRR